MRGTGSLTTRRAGVDRVFWSNAGRATTRSGPRSNAPATSTLDREQARMKDEFVNLISHELRTPLSSILGYLELVIDDEDNPLSPEQLTYLGTVERNANRLLRLVSDLLLPRRSNPDVSTCRRSPSSCARCCPRRSTPPPARRRTWCHAPAGRLRGPGHRPRGPGAPRSGRGQPPLPMRQQIDSQVAEQLILEFYSK